VIAIFQTFKSMGLSEMGSLFGAALKVGFAGAVNMLWKGLSGAMAAVGTILVERIKTVAAMFAEVAKPEFWKGIGAAILAAALSFGAILTGVIAKILAAMKKAGGVAGRELIGNQEEKLANQSADMAATAESMAGNAGDNLAPILDVYSKRMGAELKAVSSSFKDATANTGNILDASDSKGELNELVRSIRELTIKGITARQEPTKVEGGAETGGGNTENSLPQINSRLAGAINTIAGTLSECSHRRRSRAKTRGARLTRSKRSRRIQRADHKARAKA